MSASIEEQITRIINEYVSGGGRPPVTLETRFADVADSLEKVELMMRLEEEFDVEIKDDDIKQIVTVQDAMKAIRRKLAEHA